MKKDVGHIVIWLIINAIWSLYIIDAGMIAVPFVFVMFMIAPIAGTAIYIGSWYLIGFFFGKVKPHSVIIFVFALLIAIGNWVYVEVKEEQRREAIERNNQQYKIERAINWVEQKDWDSETDKKYATALFSYLQKDESGMNHIYNNYRRWTTYNNDNEPDNLEQYWTHGRHTVYKQ